MAKSIEDVKSIILSNLKFGRDNAISRVTLVQLTGANDRTNRKAIESLISDDLVPVCSYSSGKGYFIAATVEEAQHTLNERHKRAMKHLVSEYAFKKFIHEQRQEVFEWKQNLKS